VGLEIRRRGCGLMKMATIAQNTIVTASNRNGINDSAAIFADC
jgi:hypothetical protein